MENVKLTPYLNFNGTCRDAMEFYKSVLGGDLYISTFKEYEGPSMSVPEDYQDKVMHASLVSEHFALMASDAPPKITVVMGNNFSLSLSGTNGAALTRLFEGLSTDGTITVPLSKQVWGDTFGMFADKFGIHWSVNIRTATARS